MNNIFLIYGNEDYLINKNLNEILKSINSNDNISRYNLDTDSIESVLIDASTVSMFDDKKVIICDNSTFLTSEGKLENDENFLRYIENAFKDVYLIFIVRNEKLDERKKIVKSLKKVSKVIVCNKIENYDLSNYVYEYIKENGFKIDRKDIETILKRSLYNLSIITNELNKLFVYKKDNKNITSEDIDKVITSNINDNIFDLTNMVVNGEKEKLIDTYNNLIRMGEDPFKLMVTLSNQYRLILEVKLMVKNGYKDDEIISKLKEHPYRIKLAKNSLVSIEESTKKLEQLADLNYNIVTGKVDSNFGFEMFLLNL
ncbi:MAG: DNA polymerase III subunit delta [Bacilli bacterium]|nr:DNA polymerase III subunit delta [Bacilli bacterium]